jgi:integrase
VSLYKRGGVFWSYISMDGVRHSQSTGTGNRRRAETIEQRFKEELNLKRHHVAEPAPHMTFGELAARFLAEGDAKPWHTDRLKLLLPYWSEIPIGRIHKGLTADYRKRRHAEKKVTDTTINRDLEALRHILFWAADEGFLLGNPLARMRMVPERRKPRAVLALPDEALLLKGAATHLRSIIIAAIDTGMRRGELLHQRWEHIDWARKLLFVTRSKTAGGEGREIPFTERLASLLLAERREEGLVFTYEGNPIVQIKTAWKTAIRHAGIRYCRFHDLRHSFNTRLMEAGVMQEVRKALMGHSSGEDVNSIYTHVELPMKREAIRKLEAWVRNQEISKSDQKGGPDGSKESGAGCGSANARQRTTEAVEKEDPGRSRARPNRQNSGGRGSKVLESN